MKKKLEMELEISEDQQQLEILQKLKDQEKK